jgi:hypothetical protein
MELTHFLSHPLAQKFEHDAFRYDSPTESEVDGPADYEIVDVS